MDWLIDFYGFFGAKHQRASLIVVTLLGACITGLFWKFLGSQWERRIQFVTPAVQPSPSSTIDGNHNQKMGENNGTAIQNNTQ